jgi:hypothetical protein
VRCTLRNSTKRKSQNVDTRSSIEKDKDYFWEMKLGIPYESIIFIEAYETLALAPSLPSSYLLGFGIPTSLVTSFFIFILKLSHIPWHGSCALFVRISYLLCWLD